LAVINKRPDILPRQDFKSSYFDCSLPYVKRDHYTADITADSLYFSDLRSYIKIKFHDMYFIYPELNRGNNSISQRTEYLFRKYFKPINRFENSLFENELGFDTHYHLNKCGAERNTNYLREALTKAGVRPFTISGGNFEETH